MFIRPFAPKVVHAEVRENFARTQDARCEGNRCFHSRVSFVTLPPVPAIVANKRSDSYQPVATLVEH